MIDESDEDENADDSIRVECEFDSNIMNEGFKCPSRIRIGSGSQDCSIPEAYNSVGVTVSIEPSFTITRRSEDFVEPEERVLCFDRREDFVKVKKLETVVKC
jgi:hypothetical protein